MQTECERFRIEGMPAPIVAEVAERGDSGLVVIRDLPFLKRGASVLDQGDRSARIARVAVDVERDVPRLVLELAYDEAFPRRRRRDPTVGYERPTSSAPPPPPAAEPRLDTTQRTVATWMEEPGSELQLAARSWLARLAAAAAALLHGFAQAFAALRTDP